MHDRGSNGASAWVGAVGGCSDTDGDDGAAVVVELELGVVPDEADVPFDGALTERFDPVTTVTSAPSVVGAWPRVAGPVNECSTCSASARWRGEE